MPAMRGQLARPKEAQQTIKFFETVDEATSQIEVATRQYDRAISPVDEGNVAVPEEIRDKMLPGASPMAKDLARERIEATASPAQPFRGLARWYKEREEAKYSKDEWKHARDWVAHSAVARRRAATSTRERTEQTRSSTKLHLQRTGGQVRHTFHERVMEINEVMKKLKQSKKQSDVECSLMENSFGALVMFLENRFEWPLKANSLCRVLRDGRIGIDYVEDEVDMQLDREFEMLQQGHESLLKVREQAEDFLGTLRTLSQQVADDTKRKKAATNCDNQLQKLSLDAETLRLNLNILNPALSKSMVSNDDWVHASADLMAMVEQNVAESKQLRKSMSDYQSDIDQKLKRYESDLTSALRERLVEYEEASFEDENILKQCRYEISTLNLEIQSIHKSIDSQMQPIKRNTTRLERRKDRRPNEEQTDDLVQASLVKEAAEISAAVQALTAELEVNEANMVELRKMESMLEEDIMIKTRSIKIEKKCIYNRSYFAKFKAEEEAKNHQPNPR